MIEFAMKTAVPAEQEGFEDLLQQAVLVHNAVPHSSTGEAPARLVFGTDLALPGWKLFVRPADEEVRLVSLKARRLHAMIMTKIRTLKRIDQKVETFKKGDFVLYQFKEHQEKRPLQHASGVAKWAPEWSLPCRVVDVVSRNAVKLKQLWTEKENIIVRPTSEVRLLSRPLPFLLKKDALELLRLEDAHAGWCWTRGRVSGRNSRHLRRNATKRKRKLISQGGWVVRRLLPKKLPTSCNSCN